MEQRDITIIKDVNLEVTVELGQDRQSISDILKIGPGATIDLYTRPDKLVNVYVNDKLVALGQIVVIGDNYGVRITQLLEREQ